MQMSDEFENVQIDEENMFEEMEAPVLPSKSEDFQNFIEGKEILQLKNNTIPKGLIPLGEFFDNNDVSQNPKVTPNEVEVEDCNIGT